MGVCYQSNRLDKYQTCGTRLFDLEIYNGANKLTLYSLLDYSKFTVLVFDDAAVDDDDVLPYINTIKIYSQKRQHGYWAASRIYINQRLVVRPDSYIESCEPILKVQ